MKALFQKFLITQLTLVACISAQAQTLSEAVRSVLQENPNVLTRVNSRMAADEGLKQAKGGYYPTVDLNAGWGNENSENSTTLASDNDHLTLK